MKLFMKFFPIEEHHIAIKVPPVELKHLSKAPLQLALAQVRFAPIFAVEEPARMAEFQARLGRRYLMQPPPPDSGPAGAPVDRIYLFRDQERAWTVSLNTGSLGLEAKTYHDFDEFAGELSRILGDVTEIFAPQTEVRLGVRYVNRIEDERLGKRGIQFFVRGELASPVGSELGDELANSLCELRFRERGTWLAIRHGLVEPSVYLLDFDNFAEGERDFVPAEIVKRVTEYHGLIERLFVWSLSGRYLEELQEESK
jgi:uncharacterized protein (TIGR04255 family)